MSVDMLRDDAGGDRRVPRVPDVAWHPRGRVAEGCARRRRATAEGGGGGGMWMEEEVEGRGRRRWRVKGGGKGRRK